MADQVSSKWASLGPESITWNLTGAIKELYIGTEGNLTQKKMEEFFSVDGFFRNATPGYFNLVRT